MSLYKPIEKGLKIPFQTVFIILPFPASKCAPPHCLIESLRYLFFSTGENYWFLVGT